MVEALGETNTENPKILRIRRKTDKLQKKILNYINENNQEKAIEILEQFYNNICLEFAEEIENAYRIGIADGLELQKKAI